MGFHGRAGVIYEWLTFVQVHQEMVKCCATTQAEENQKYDNKLVILVVEVVEKVN